MAGLNDDEPAIYLWLKSENKDDENYKETSSSASNLTRVRK